MGKEYNSNHQEIGGIQAGNLNDVIEEGKDLIAHMDLSQRDMEVVPDLTQLANDIALDLEKCDTTEAYVKLHWYFTRSSNPMAHAECEEDVLEVLCQSAPDGAYAINPNKYVEMQMGLREIYNKLKAAQERANPALKSTMRKR